MLKGIAVVDGEQIGTFELVPYPVEQIVVSFKDGLRVQQYLEHVTENALTVELQMAPEYGD